MIYYFFCKLWLRMYDFFYNDHAQKNMQFKLQYIFFHCSSDSPCNRPAVLFSHGLGGDSTEFYMNPPESSPGIILFYLDARIETNPHDTNATLHYKCSRTHIEEGW